MEKRFKIKAAGSSVRTEILAGLTTFFTMSYIIFVNPNILSVSGMPWGGVFVATILATIAGTLVMGLYANVPYAVAPGMGLNAFFTFTVCIGLGFAWQEALAMVFICGIINILITVTKLRKSIVKSIPPSLQSAIGGAVGLFIMYIGIKDAGWLSFLSDPGKNIVLEGGTVIADSSIVPSLVDFTSPVPQLALIGLILILGLMVIEKTTGKSFGSILIGIVLTAVIGIFMGVTQVQGVKVFDISSLGEVSQTAFAFFGNPGLGSLFNDPARLPVILITIFSFSLSDTFDTVGTFIGTGRRTGIFDKEDEEALYTGSGFSSRMDKALFADSIATSVGALFGTSNTTTYVESAAGIGVGGRTGLTSVVVAILFALCLPFAGLFGVVPSAATAPALIIVGILMSASFLDIKWDDIIEAAPALMTAGIMAFAYSISYGIAAGFILYIVCKLFSGKIKEVHPIIAVTSLLFILNFVLLAVE